VIDIVGLSYREAARALRAKEATITTRLHRGRARLVENLTAARPAPAPSVPDATKSR
jgi:RNA polymerase sigma-70 factor (ECF subfamily)